MGLRQPKQLSDVLRWDANLRITCTACGREGVYDTRQILDYFLHKRWNTVWEEVPRRFRCDKINGGCGLRAARVSMEPKPLPPSLSRPEPLPQDIKARQRRSRG